jgi:hypothetical protein
VNESEMNVSQPWFAPGLPFTCTQCGNCCTGEPGFVWVDDDEIRAIASHLNVGYGDVKYFKTRQIGDRVSLREHANGDCVFLDGQTRRCLIYPVRPKQCRTWPFWNTNLASPEAWRDVQGRCPGAGQGTFVPLDEILHQASLIEM